MNNKYTMFKFEYYFYNYNLKRSITSHESIKAKSIDDAEKIFWRRMNGRNVKIKTAYYMDFCFEPYTIKKGRAFWKKVYSAAKYYYYKPDGKTRRKDE